VDLTNSRVPSSLARRREDDDSASARLRSLFIQQFSFPSQTSPLTPPYPLPPYPTIPTPPPLPPPPIPPPSPPPPLTIPSRSKILSPPAISTSPQNLLFFTVPPETPTKPTSKISLPSSTPSVHPSNQFHSHDIPPTSLKHSLQAVSFSSHRFTPLTSHPPPKPLHPSQHQPGKTSHPSHR